MNAVSIGTVRVVNETAKAVEVGIEHGETAQEAFHWLPKRVIEKFEIHTQETDGQRLILDCRVAKWFVQANRLWWATR